MELTPELLLEAKFSSARRGYDMAEVDDFLERCAEGLDVLLVRLRAEFDRAEAAEAELESIRAGATTFAPSPVPEAPAAEPEAEPEPVAEARPEPVEPEEERRLTVGEPMRILVHAERTAEAAIAEATAEAERIRTEAEAVATAQRSEAETMLERARTEAEAEARQAGEEVRRAIQGEVVVLRQDRDTLAEDIRLLRRWLDEQRGRLRSTALDLQRLADDPNALRDIDVPTTSTHGEAGEDAAGHGAAENGTPGNGGAGHPSEWGPEEGDTVVELTDDARSPEDEGPSDGEPTQAIPAYNHFSDDRSSNDRAD
jgi:DivIVA domain-containing protein